MVLLNSSPDLQVVNSFSFIPLKYVLCLSEVIYRAVQIWCLLNVVTGRQQIKIIKIIISCLVLKQYFCLILLSFRNAEASDHHSHSLWVLCYIWVSSLGLWQTKDCGFFISACLQIWLLSLYSWQQAQNAALQVLSVPRWKDACLSSTYLALCFQQSQINL